MLQMIQELRALRVRVMQGWREAERGLTNHDIGELLRFIGAIDQLISDSVASYSARKEQETRLFEAMLKVSPTPPPYSILTPSFCFSTFRWQIWPVRQSVMPLANPA